MFDNEHTTYKIVKIGDVDASLGTSTVESGISVYILNWGQDGIAHMIMGNIPMDEVFKIAESIS